MDLKDDINNKWMIEEVYTSGSCRHSMVGYCTLGYINHRKGVMCFKQCTKETCPLKVGGKK